MGRSLDHNNGLSRVCCSLSILNAQRAMVSGGQQSQSNLTVGLTTALHTVMVIHNTVLYGCGLYHNRTCTHKIKALDGTVMAINGHIMVPYGSMSIPFIQGIMYVHVWSANLIIVLALIT